MNSYLFCYQDKEAPLCDVYLYAYLSDLKKIGVYKVPST